MPRTHSDAPTRQHNSFISRALEAYASSATAAASGRPVPRGETTPFGMPSDGQWPCAMAELDLDAKMSLFQDYFQNFNDWNAH
jgi:hypothetical protein